jgi:hypothetical protein
MTKMPQPVMLACAFGGCACGRSATGKDAPWGGGVGAGGGGAVRCRKSWMGVRKVVVSTVGNKEAKLMVGEKFVSAGEGNVSEV